MQPHLRMCVQKIPHSLGFMRREIVENDVNLLFRPALRNDLPEEIHEVGAGVTHRRFSMHATGLGVECGVQRQRAMAVICEPVALGAPGTQSQYRVQTVERLNRRFLIYTKYRGLSDRAQ